MTPQDFVRDHALGGGPTGALIGQYVVKLPVREIATLVAGNASGLAHKQFEPALRGDGVDRIYGCARAGRCKRITERIKRGSCGDESLLKCGQRLAHVDDGALGIAKT